MSDVVRKALIIFAKEPVIGKVKTRLAQDILKKYPQLNSDQAYQKSMEAFKLFCQQIAQRNYNNIDVFVFYASNGTPRFLNSIWPHTPFIEQVEGDLGIKMSQAFLKIKSLNYTSALCIGTDSPDLPQDYIEDGFQLIQDFPVVLGPTEDGGYYTIGINLEKLNEISPLCFDSIPWSTDQVFQMTKDRLDKNNFTLGVLPKWYDIDELSELKRFLLTHTLNHPMSKYFELFKN